MITVNGTDYDCDLTYKRNAKIAMKYSITTKDYKRHVQKARTYQNVNVVFGNNNNTQYEQLRAVLLDPDIPYHTITFPDGGKLKTIEAIVSVVSDEYFMVNNDTIIYTGMEISFEDRG